MSKPWEDATQRRWQRRYAGRRFVLGVPVDAEPIGSMVDQMLALDIATRRVWHALRPTMYAVLRALAAKLREVTG
jgi:hypothetical protein